MQGRISLTDWTPDGKWILMSSDLQTPGRVALCLVPDRRCAERRDANAVIASNPEYSLWQGRFSPDGRWISFNAFNATDPSVSTVYVSLGIRRRMGKTNSKAAIGTTSLAGRLTARRSTLFPTARVSSMSGKCGLIQRAESHWTTDAGD